MALSKELKRLNVREISEDALEVKFIHGRNNWRVITVYSQSIEETFEKLTEEIEEKKEQLIIEEDFNARTGEEGGPIGEEKNGKEGKRRSKDKVINREGNNAEQAKGERMDDTEWKLWKAKRVERQELQ